MALTSQEQELMSYASDLHQQTITHDITRGKNYVSSKGKSISALKITPICNKTGWSADFDVTAMSCSPFTDILEEVGPISLFKGGQLVDFERGTTEVISVCFANVQRKLEDDDYKEFLKRNTRIHVTTKGLLALLVPGKEGWHYEACFAAGVIRPADELGEDHEYIMFKYSPSEERKATIKFYRSDIPADRIEELNDLMTCGTADEYKGKTKPMNKVVKKVARYSLMDPGGIWKYFDIKKYGAVIYLGKMGGDQERTDGGAKLSAELVADLMNISVECATGQFYQTRCYTAKTADTVETQWDLKMFVDIVCRDYDTEVLHFDTFEELAEVADNIKGKIAWVGNPDRIGIFSDLQGFKAVPRKTTPAGVKNLGFLDAGRNGQAHTNRQLLQFTQEYPGFKKLLIKLGTRHVHNRMRNIFRSHNYINGVSFNVDKMYVANVLPQISGETLKQGYLSRGIEKGLVSSLNRAIHDVHFDLDGVYLRGTGAYENWTCVHESQFLHDDEVFVNQKKFWGQKVAVCRNPRSYSCETFICNKIPSLYEIVKRIASSDCTVQEKIYYTRRYAMTSLNVVVTPGSSNFKDKTGGSDFDYDGFIVIRDPEFIEMLESKPAFSVNIYKDASSPEEIKCPESTIEMVQKAFQFNQCSGNKGVGNMAIENSKVQTLLNCTEPKIKEDAYRYFVKLMLGDEINDTGKKYYKRQYTEDCVIGENDVLRNVAEFKSSKMDMQVVTDFLEDMSVACVSIIGRIIDAAKDGSVVTDPFDIGDSCVLDSFAQLSRAMNDHGMPFAYIGWDKKNKEFTAVYEKGSFVKSRDEYKKFFLSDPIYECQVEIIKWAVKRINWHRKHNMPDIQERTRDKEWKNSLRGVMSSLKELDKTSSDAQRSRTVSNRDSQAVGEKAANICRPYIANMARMILTHAGVSDDKRFEAAMSINDLAEGSSFAYNNLKEESLYYAMGLKGATSIIRETVIPVCDEPSLIPQTFVNGRSPYFLCTTYRFNGVYAVKEEDGRYFIETDLKELVQIPSFDDRIILRLKTHKGEYDELIPFISEQGKYQFYIHSFLADPSSPDSIRMIDTETGEDTEFCRIRMGNDSWSAVMHHLIIHINDVIHETFQKDLNTGATQEIDACIALCSVTGKKD